MDDIDSILNDFDAIYAKADAESTRPGRGQPPVEEEEEELDVMDFMTSPSKGHPMSMESNDNLDDQINSFIRKNSKTENNVQPYEAASKKEKKRGKKAKSVALAEPMEEEPVLSDDDPVLDLSEDNAVGYDQADEQGEEDDYVDDAENPETSEESAPHVAQRKERPYQTNMTRPAVQYGHTKLTYGEAKLYGLLDENGNIKIKCNNDSFKRSREAVLHSRAMAERKEPTKLDVSEEEKELTFKPMRSKEANKAMHSRGCGYDFVNRLGEGGDFLQRAFAKGEKGKAEKRLQEAMKEDYEARLDRLKCPKCNKFQAFDEFIEKKRSCQQCHVRYVKASVSHPKAYAKKQEEAEQRRRERLKKIEDELYPPLPKHSGQAGGKSLIERTNELMIAQKEQARAEQEAKKKAQIDALAKARAPPKPVTQPVRVPIAEGKPPRPFSGTPNTTSAGAKSSGSSKLKTAIKHSVISEKFNKLIQYPTEAEAK